MQKLYSKISILASCALLIVASGGEPNSEGLYELYSSTAAKTSVLSGSTQQANNASGALKLLSVSGSLVHNSGKLNVDDGNYSLTDDNGPDSKKIFTDGGSTLTYNGGFSGSYKYALTYQQAYELNGVTYDANGIIGIATKSADMPTSSSVTYNGEATAVVVTASSGHDLKSGTSQVVANFGTGKASITLNGFTSFNQVTGLAQTAPIDEIKITDISINGNGFSGGTFVTSKSGTTVDITGANSSKTSQSQFYGLNSAGTAPAETGGHVLMQGDDGIISGSYLAK